MKKEHWLGIIFLSLGLLGCSTSAVAESPPSSSDPIGQVVTLAEGGQYVDITPQELKSMLEQKDFFFVNVHVPYEGEIPGTEAFIPFDDIAGNLGEFPSDLDARIVLYCRSGSMSAISARDLVGTGYRNVFNVDGGFRAWSDMGFEFIH